MKHNVLDLRFIIGLFFGLMGLILIATSFFAQPSMAKPESTNLWSGIVYVVFGVFMVILWLIGKKEPVNDKDPEFGESADA